MFTWMADGSKVLAAAILVATVLMALMFRYETWGNDKHRNRFTGTVCSIANECWFSSDPGLLASANGASQRKPR
jgi:hypothetical protein